MSSDQNPESPSRRAALAWLARAGVLLSVPPGLFAGIDPSLGLQSAPGYGRDPNLIDPRRPWPLTLTSQQRATVARLADLVLPADANGPTPSTIGIADFIDEWVSAPYPEQLADRGPILEGVAMLDRQAGGSFAGTNAAKATQLLVRIADGGNRDISRDVKPVDFFNRFRHLCLLGYYTSDMGMRDIGHIVPPPAAEFSGPPAAIRLRLGV